MTVGDHSKIEPDDPPREEDVAGAEDTEDEALSVWETLRTSFRIPESVLLIP